MLNCLCFGDSITYGEYDGFFGGWVDILKRHFHREKNINDIKEVNVFNLGKGGETTAGLIKRVKIESEARKADEENIIFFGYGANDLAQINGVATVSTTDFEKNLSHAVDIAKEITPNVYLLNILPISFRIDKVTSTNGKVRSNEHVKRYNESVSQVAKQNAIEYVDLYSLFDGNTESLLSLDGLHPNGMGYNKISESIKPIIKRLL
ncbi:MAG: SGNH/GDSL hydrolase family protein [Chitinophagaceae bacterium]